MHIVHLICHECAGDNQLTLNCVTLYLFSQINSKGSWFQWNSSRTTLSLSLNCVCICVSAASVQTINTYYLHDNNVDIPKQRPCFVFQIKAEADLIPSQINLKSKSLFTNCLDFLSICFKICMWVNILLKNSRCWIQRSHGNRWTKSNKIAKP